MPLTQAEFDFLDGYVHEVYEPSMIGPHTQALRTLGATQMDLSWLLTAYHQKALSQGRAPLGSHHPEPAALPWSSREEILSRGRQVREELDHDELARASSG
jgi:hypothetical protein